MQRDGLSGLDSEDSALLLRGEEGGGEEPPPQRVGHGGGGGPIPTDVVAVVDRGRGHPVIYRKNIFPNHLNLIFVVASVRETEGVRGCVVMAPGGIASVSERGRRGRAPPPPRLLLVL